MNFILLLLILATAHSYTNETDSSRPGWKDVELIGGELEDPGDLPQGDYPTNAVPPGESPERSRPLILSGLDGLPYLSQNSHSTPELKELMSKGWGFAVDFYLKNGVYRMPTGLVEDLAEIGVVVDFDRSTADIRSEIEERSRREKEARNQEIQKQREEEARKDKQEDQNNDEDQEEGNGNYNEDSDKQDSDKEEGKETNDGSEKTIEQKSEPGKTKKDQPAEPDKQNLDEIISQPDPKDEPKRYQVIGGEMIPITNPKTIPKEHTYSPDVNGIWWDSYIRPRVNPLPEAQIVLPNSVKGSQIAKPGTSPFPKPQVQTRATSVEDTLVNWSQ
ncbi:hypothetical protein HOF92_06785 [bacterium]|nr:hypothetical protein [bacterium]